MYSIFREVNNKYHFYSGPFREFTFASDTVKSYGNFGKEFVVNTDPPEYKDILDRRELRFTLTENEIGATMCHLNHYPAKCTGTWGKSGALSHAAGPAQAIEILMKDPDNLYSEGNVAINLCWLREDFSRDGLIRCVVDINEWWRRIRGADIFFLDVYRDPDWVAAVFAGHMEQ